MQAETKSEYQYRVHEMRLTMGGMGCETLMWHNDTHADYTGLLSPTAVAVERQRTTWSPHLGLEYSYRVLPWLSVGLMTDYQYTGWHNQGYNNLNQMVSDSKEYFYNLCLLPTVRFTYFYNDYVNLYSSIGFGLDINGGTELDLKGRNTAFGMVTNVTVLGLKAGYGRWFGLIEVGGMTGMQDMKTIFMVSSRILSIGVGVSL